MALRAFIIFCLSAVLAGCATTSQAPVGEQAYQALDQAARPSSEGYPLGPLDEISINVFYEPELSFERIVIDSAGTFPYPFVGTVDAKGKTAGEISSYLRERLSQGYVNDPQVSVFVLESAQQKLTVGGEVTKPGVYPIKGPSTLMEALALAGGPLRTADLDQVLVFRKRGEETYVARFDLEQISLGNQADPVLQGGDSVIVGINEASRLYRDILQVAPLLTVVFFRL